MDKEEDVGGEGGRTLVLVARINSIQTFYNNFKLTF